MAGVIEALYSDPRPTGNGEADRGDSFRCPKRAPVASNTPPAGNGPGYGRGGGERLAMDLSGQARQMGHAGGYRQAWEVINWVRGSSEWQVAGPAAKWGAVPQGRRGTPKGSRVTQQVNTTAAAKPCRESNGWRHCSSGAQGLRGCLRGDPGHVPENAVNFR